MWNVDVIQEDNSKSNAWNANIDQTKLKTHGNMPIVQLCKAAIRGFKEAALAVIKCQSWNEFCL